MIQHIPARQRHCEDHGWLRTCWLFSFNDYYDEQNVQFGALRVFNDDVVQPGGGFPTHGHRDMEIITIPLTGELTHKDSTGGEGAVRAGEVQRMTAGTGLRHSEMNDGKTPVHFHQIWIFPRQEGLTPGYAQKMFDPKDWQGRLLPLVSGQQADLAAGALDMEADATVYRGAFNGGQGFEFQTAPDRRLFVYLGAGRGELNGLAMGPGDQARVGDETALRFRAQEGCELVLVDAPSVW